MIRLANVLVVDAGRKLAATLTDALVAAGYSVTAAPAGADPAARVMAEHPDLVLIGDDGPGSMALAATLKGDPATDDIPLLLICDEVTSSLAVEAFEAGFDDTLATGCDTVEMLARMRPLVRLATMHAELSHRAAVARRFDVAARDRVGHDESGARPAILVAGDAPGAVDPVLAAEAELVHSTSLYEAETLLTSRNFDAAVLSFSAGAASGDDILGFCTQVRHNPRLFNLPIVLVQADGVAAAEAYRRGASRVLAPPVEPQALRAAILTLVRRQQLRWSIRSAMGESLAVETRDAETGAYSQKFQESYLQDRLAFAIASHRHLAVVVFSAPNIDGVQRQFGDDAALHLTQQLGQWITGLLRAEDLVARTGRHEFCVVLPDTPLAEAQVVMHRIAGVLAYTDFAVRDVYQPVKVWVQVGATDARADDDIGRLLARARQHIE